MTEFSEDIKKAIKKIENNLKDKNDVEFVKNIFMDLFKKMETKLSNVEDRMNSIEEKLNKMQEDFYYEEECDEDTIEISCPYCNNMFEMEIDETKTELQCPECNNIIELDWNCCDEDEECGSGGCSHCHGCSSEENQNEEQDEDDDM